MIPVALFAYNRPVHLAQVLQGLKRNNIKLLYVFLDGAKEGDSEDADRVKKAGDVISGISWVKAEVVRSEFHKGADKSVLDGVSRVLSKSDKIIVLEDDCVPSPYFYDYMRQCLEYYENDEKIGCISAYLHPLGDGVFKDYPYDIFFWKRFASWGWGTWRRVWENFTPDLETLLKKAKAARVDTSAFGEDVSLRNLERKLKNARKAGRLPPWDAPFFLSMALHNTFAVYPTASQARNIGYDGSGASCGISSRHEAGLAEWPLAVKLRFPPQIGEDERFIRQMLDFINYDPRPKYLKNIKKMLKLLLR